MDEMQYWQECLSESFDEHGIVATAEQIAAVAADAKDIRDTRHMAFADPSPPRETEADRLRKELAAERDKITCRKCNGTGVLVEPFGDRVSRSECHKCRGYGRHAP